MVSQARGVGLLGALELVQDKSTRKPFDASTGVLVRLGEEVLAQGLICRPLRDAIALSPPLIITETQIDELFDKLGRAMDATLAFARGLKLAA